MSRSWACTPRAGARADLGRGDRAARRARGPDDRRPAAVQPDPARPAPVHQRDHEPRARCARSCPRCYRMLGSDETAHLVDGIKSLGFKYATRGGMTIAVSDIPVPPNKAAMLAEAEEQIKRIDEQFQRGLITDDERYDAGRGRSGRRPRPSVVRGHVQDDGAGRWTRRQPSSVSGGSVWMMTSSGARGNKGNIGQLGGMRGLMADPTGRIIDVPVRSNFREGMTVLEYFISTHGARKGLADTALRTADSGYLTRRLVDVAQDVITRDDDCGTRGGRLDHPARDGGVRGHRARRVPPAHRRPLRGRARLRAQGQEEGRAHRGAQPGDRRGARRAPSTTRASTRCSSARRSPASHATASAAPATAATWRPASGWASARRWASSPRSPSASPARS